MLRRMATVITFVTLDGYMYFQSALMTIMSTVHIIYILTEMPFLVNQHNWLEFFNEIVILLCCYPQTILMNTIPDKLKDRLGWFMVIMIAINIGINLSYVLFQTMRAIYGWC